MPRVTRMVRRRPSENVTPEETELVNVAKILPKVFNAPNEKDQQEYPFLAAITQEVFPVTWEKNPNSALNALLRVAIGRLPGDEHPDGFDKSWKYVGEFLLGYTGDLPARANGLPHTYDSRYKVIKEAYELAIGQRIAERSYQRKIPEILRTTLVSILRQLKQEGPIESSEKTDKGVGSTLHPAHTDLPGQSPPLDSRTKKQVGIATITALLLAAVSATLIVQHWQQPEPPSSPVIVNPAVAEPLIATVTSINSTADSISAVFPRGSDKSGDFTKTIDESADLDLQKLLLDEMAAGAYSHGGAEVRMTVEGNADREVTITDIRPVNIERKPAATGELILGPSMGTGTPPERMGFILDRVNPDARVVNEDGSYGPDYFKLRSLGVSNRSKQTIILEFTAQASAFSFDIQIDYEVGGQQFHHIVEKDGKPLRLRASADLCPRRQPPNEIPQADQKFLEGAQYSGRSITRTDEAGMYIERLNPVCNE